MGGDGLLALHARDGHTLPLALAARHLSRSLAALDEPPPEAAEQLYGWQLLRIELPVAAPSRPTQLLLDWLEAQAELAPRAFFATRDGSVLLAGAGAAHVFSEGAGGAASAGARGGGTGPGGGQDGGGPEGAAGEGRLLPEISHLTHERIRYVGGVRFDAADPEASPSSAEWAAFGRCFWVLPRLELSTGDVAPRRVPAAAESTESTETASSCVSTSLAGAEQAGEGPNSAAALSVQLRWRAREAGAWAAEKRRALEALGRLRPCGPGGALPAAVARRSDAVPRDAFEAGVREALRAFREGALQKVVLARRTLLELAQEADPVGVLRQVVGGTYKRHYLFVLEPAKGSAFISLTPERLCRVHGCDIWTEAVAGTWPIAEFERAGEAALLTSSAKHNSEHQLVVDYICKLLSSVSQHVKVCDTHILKLKHLVHIKQSYHAIARGAGAPQGPPAGPAGDATAPAPGAGPAEPAAAAAGEAHASVPFGISSFFCERMSPTPAVCGLPLDAARRFIRGAEPFDRGFYAAPCGIVSGRGSELVVALRSALLQGGRRLFAFAGAGVVPGSSPAEEFEEISLKMRQFTEGLPAAAPGTETPGARLRSLQAMPNLNTLWAHLVVEECVRSGLRNFVICPGSRSTPLVVAVQRNPNARGVVNHDERGAAFYALGWAKAVGAPVAVIVTSGTAVANLLPAAVEASQAQVPLVLLTADRPSELRDTGANQTITQPGIFGVYTRWAKDLECPSVQFPAHALLSDVDLAVASAAGRLSGHPGPVHLNFCFRENLAPDGGPVRGAPALDSAWDASYMDTPEMHRWASLGGPWSSYVPASPSLGRCAVPEELLGLGAAAGSRVVVVVGTLQSTEEALCAEDIALRLGAAVFADITSGLRQQPSAVGLADQLLASPLLAGELLQIDALVRLGGAVCSARLAAFSKAARPRLLLRVAGAPLRLDQDHAATHHLACSLEALAEALADAGLERRAGPPALWRELSDAAGQVLDDALSAGGGLTEPFVARAVSRLLSAGSQLQISSSMPIRDLDFFARPHAEADAPAPPSHPPSANRGASGIDGVLSTAAGFCRGTGAPTTLVIGDVASLHDLNALQQLAGPDAPPLTVVLVNNGGAGIFSFLPIAQHQSVMTPFFTEPHATDFSAACRAFRVPHVLCETAEDFEAAYIRRQRKGAGGACVIEVRACLSHEENVALHRRLGQAVADRVRAKLLSKIRLSWLCTPGALEGAEARMPALLLHGWLGEKGDWAEVSQRLAQAGQPVLAVDLPGHGATEVGACRDPDPWEAAALLTLPLAAEALVELLDRLRIDRAAVVGYSLGGRVAATLAARHPGRVLGSVILSAHPGLRSPFERQQRASDDLALAARLSALRSPGDMDVFLERWYAAPLWAGLAERRSGVYERMLSRRRRASPRRAARALLGMSLARQADLWPKGPGAAPGPRMWYAHGALDEKFGAVGEELRRILAGAPAPGEQPEQPERPRVLALPGAGHALVEECPGEVAALCLEAAAQLLEAAPRPPPAPLPTCVQLLAAWSEPVELRLNAPLRLSRGDPMPVRRGALIVLEARRGDGAVAGVGEVSPLPMFHQESLAQAQRQLGAVLQAWTASPPAVPLELARLDGAMGRWLEGHCPGGGQLLPSVRAGLEMALLHLTSRAAGAPHLGAPAVEARGASCSSGIGINGLVVREEDLCELHDGPLAVKVKVGRDPAEDARRTNRLAELLERQVGPRARLRLDANQAWAVGDAVGFVEGLSDRALALTEYWEEPVAPGSLVADWEQLSSRTGGRIRLAVDESLTEGSIGVEDLAACKAPLAALILKPALQGLERSLELAVWAAARGMRPVLSSAFESGVALCHFSILAASMAPQPWHPETGVSACHGLGTFTHLAEDVLNPPFADLVYSRHGSGWGADLLRCQDALDQTVDALVCARGAPRSGAHG